MKAITLKQPWASLIIEGIKDVENRTWKTNFRGRVLIHASAKPIDKFSACLNKAQTFDFQNKSNIPFDYNKNLWVYNQMEFACNHKIGAIIGSVEIVDCVINHPSIWAERIVPIYFDDAGLPVYEKPIYNWVLANPILFPEPISCKGKLSFWEYEKINSELDDDGTKYAPVKLE